MKNKYILFNTIVIVIALVLMLSLGITVTRNNNKKQAEDEVIRITKIYASNYDSEYDYNQNIDNDLRISIIDSTGKVIADSFEDINIMENHIDRDEIIAALKGKPETYIRKSNTTKDNMIYYALKVDTENDYVFIRVAMPISRVTDYVMNTIPSMLVVMLCALIVSSGISFLFSIKIVKPLELVKINLDNINNGKYFTTIPATADNDINKILIDINEVGEKLRNNFVELNDNKAKLDYVLNNISNGIVTFDKNEVIQLMNNSSLEIFNIHDYQNKTISYLSMDINFTNKIKSIITDSQNEIFEYSLNDNYYICTINKLESGLFILVMNDITEAKNNEIIRSEFFANASHELKTPLTSIKGFNEIVKIKNKDQTLSNYIENIEKESNRILILLDDMLKLSKLEATLDIKYEELDLLEITNEVKDELLPLYENKNIKVNINGKAKITGEKEHFHELIKNLVENAIKYNIDNGEVSINLNESSEVSIEVIDSGIGIDTADQNRIFERFYRVNKSRSRNTGGTGLGLSIVKHITQIYNGNIILSSALGKGTTIRITFKK